MAFARLVLAMSMVVACSSPVTEQAQTQAWTCTVAEANYLVLADGEGQIVRNGVLFFEGKGHADYTETGQYTFRGLPLTVGDELDVSGDIELTYEKPLLCK